ncbi:MAG: beta strand repeat-containing protein, partial [Limisphaerales bacterium]
QSGMGPLQGTTTLDIGTANGNGTVSFTNLRIDAAGTGKQLQASASGLTSASSSTFAVAHASAARLAIQTQPSTNATAGDILTNQPVIQIADNYGNTISEDNSTAVTASLHGGGTGLEGTLTLAAASGIVTFTNIYFDFAANVQLDFNGGSLPTVTSDTIHVGPAAGSRLLIDTQPAATATAGQAFSPQPVISLRDAFGNIITGDNVTQVTVTRTAGGTLLGTTTVTAVNGVFTFTDLAETVAGSMTLTFSSTGLTPLTSSSIQVNPGAVAQLSLQTQPSSTITAGTKFPQQPVVWLLDAYGNLVTTDNTTQVTASRINGSGNLQGTTTMTAIGGIVTYTNLTHFNATVMNLEFTSGSLSTTSDPVTVNAGPATHLEFAQEPVFELAGHVFDAQPIVQTTDAYGNVATDIPSSLPVTITLASGSGYLFGQTTIDAGTASGDGIAEFTNLQINAFGDKELMASAPGFTSAVSDVFTIDGTVQPFAKYGGSYSIGGTANSIWVGNFRAASTARDVVVGNYDDNTITIRLSNDDGTFASSATYAVAGHPVAVRAADLNGDGYDDLIIAYADTNMVTVMLSTGSHGTNFATGVGYITSTSSNSGISAIFLTDLNGDGHQDLIVANSVDNTVSVLSGTSASGFSSPVTYNVGTKPMWIHVADMNGDNRQDIITANYTSGTISILPGQAGGTFGSAQSITLFPGGTPQPIRVVTPDVNRDGRLDLAVVNYASNTLSILLQQTNGTYAMSTNYNVGTHPSDFFLRDLDGNGISDLAVLNSGSGTVDLFFNNGTGSYVVGGTIAVGPGPVSMFGGKFSSALNMNALVVADAVSSNMSVLFYSGPISESTTINVSENRSASVVLGAHNNFFPKIYDFTITQYPTNGTISGTAPNLTYTPHSDFIGTDHLKFIADAGGVESAVATVTFTVLTVNHQPTFTMSTNYIALLQGSSDTLKNFITSKNAGAPTESAQKIDYIITNIDTNLYATVPKVATNGTLTFKLAPLARGTNDLTVYAHDNGGTARGGT